MSGAAVLDRFRRPLAEALDGAVAEIGAGRKRTHWMWFVFPQLAGLGSSPTAQHYAIADADEALAFLLDPELGAGYRRAVTATHERVVVHGQDVSALFGFPDDRKLVSSLTLFGSVARRSGRPDLAELATMCDDILDAARRQDLPACAHTAAALAGPGPGEIG